MFNVVVEGKEREHIIADGTTSRWGGDGQTSTRGREEDTARGEAADKGNTSSTTRQSEWWRNEILVSKVEEVMTGIEEEVGNSMVAEEDETGGSKAVTAGEVTDTPTFTGESFTWGMELPTRA